MDEIAAYYQMKLEDSDELRGMLLHLDAKSDPMNSRVCAGKLAALAAPERLRIVHFLRGGPHNATEIAQRLESPLVNVSHHLSVLHSAGLLCREKHIRFMVHSLVPGLLQAGDSTCALYHLDLSCCRLELPGEALPSREGTRPR